LNAILSKEARHELNTRLFIQTIRLVSQSKNIDNCLVISSDPEVIRIGKGCGAEMLEETNPKGLNAALRLGTEFAMAQSVDRIMIIPADLPLLNPSDIDLLTSESCVSPVIVLAPDRHHKGTNALVSSPPGIIQYSFGEGSFAVHQNQARESGADLRIVDTLSLALDLDTPDDYYLLMASENLKPSVKHLFEQSNSRNSQEEEK
jgi:2-phospho-L-lactate guanylyltransferase